MKKNMLNSKMKRLVLSAVAIGVIFALLYVYFSGNTGNETMRNTTVDLSKKNANEIIAKNLEVPWEVVFLPSGHMLVTERVGRLKQIDKNGRVVNELEIDEVLNIGEGGLLGLALHPNFSSNRQIFLYYTYSSNGNNTENRVVRFVYQNGALSKKDIIVDKIPGAANHNGGRIKFGPDGFLYITTGDAQEPSLAQDTNSLAGKILRVDENGKAAPGNALENRVFSYGHRNTQGLAWRRNELWATEHGPSGNDEINKIENGKNYGWPIIQGVETREGMITPVVNSGSSTWAPTGIVFLDGMIYFAGLRGMALYSLNPDNITKENIKVISDEFGRMRAVVVNNGKLFVTTSNRDGRTIPKSEDDKIIKIKLIIQSD
jgi:glucose/arabinose dehydrogenase